MIKMASVEERLNKLREERLAREKARIEKLRELNLKKYGKNDVQLPKNSSTVSLPVKSKSDASCVAKNNVNYVKNNIQSSGLKRPSSIPTIKKIPPKESNNNGKNVQSNNTKLYNKISNQVNTNIRRDKMTNVSKVDTKCPKAVNMNGKDVNAGKPLKEITPEVNIKRFNEICDKNPKITITEPKDTNKSVNNKVNLKNDLKSRKSLAAVSKNDNKSRNFDKRKSVQPNQMANSNGRRESVFDRLYKPKMVAPKETIDNALKLRTDPNYLKKVINDSRLIMNKRHTVFEVKPTMPVRRSISAVHLKKISRKELGNCFHKWASIGEKIDKVHLKDVNEDDCIKGEKVVSAVKSERKKVKFQTPIPYNFNTPKTEELQSKLRNWLKKRGKAIDSYHHLQCFGLHNLSRDIRPLNIDAPRFEEFDDDDKENVALDHDSDNESYLENMNNKNGDLNEEKSEIGFPTENWRRASYVSDSIDCNESYETTLTSGDVMHHVDELLLGALNDLTELLREGFDWEQCARWLRAIRDRFPSAPDSAPYWECRAALEERRGDLPASVQCWEQAIAKGTEQSVVEANLDQLLDKFMQLKISPSSGRRQVDPKLVDVKNIFKSTIIRFAVQQAKLRQSNEPPKYTVTPVRRSSRLSSHWRQTPLRVCTTIHQASELGADFKPNKALTKTP
ncbi:uncharacterized protein LOC125075058 [Vanessa atalanta]|uniref:uncharacterized protein LOC125075058 n=1 Tax=Vanessa atalanta TaxID=42275 RepID=UPI001FCD2515|nr:uncharacterized protein LOC125075058 [Vanessa atalanta]